MDGPLTVMTLHLRVTGNVNGRILHLKSENGQSQTDGQFTI
jgi:hypothetical protein